MKIAMLGQKGIPATYGGIERHVEELGVRLVERGHEVTVYCRPYYTKMQGDYRGIKIVNIPSVRTKHLDTATHCALALPHILASDYDIVHFHALGPSLFANLPAHSGRQDRRDRSRSRLAEGEVGLRSPRGCSSAASTRRPTTPTGPSSCRRRSGSTTGRSTTGTSTYIPNGTVLPNVRKAEKITEMGLNPGNYILFVGRLVPEKGAHYLLDAYARMDTDLELVVAGGTSFSTDYVDSLHESGGDRVRFLGLRLRGRAGRALLERAGVRAPIGHRGASHRAA